MSSVRSRRSAPGGSRRRAASRPARAGSRGSADTRQGHRRTRRAPGGATTEQRTPLFTGRAVLLGALVLLLALTLAGPVRSYVAGRQELAALAAEAQALSREEQDLRDQLERQSDPAWLAQQARTRLTFVLPGDRLVVVSDGTTADGDAGTLPDPGELGAEAPPWYTGLMESLADADG